MEVETFTNGRVGVEAGDRERFLVMKQRQSDLPRTARPRDGNRNGRTFWSRKRVGSGTKRSLAFHAEEPPGRPTNLNL